MKRETALRADAHASRPRPPPQAAGQRRDSHSRHSPDLHPLWVKLEWALVASVCTERRASAWHRGWLPYIRTQHRACEQTSVIFNCTVHESSFAGPSFGTTPPLNRTLSGTDVPTCHVTTTHALHLTTFARLVHGSLVFVQHQCCQQAPRGTGGRHRHRERTRLQEVTRRPLNERAIRYRSSSNLTTQTNSCSDTVVLEPWGINMPRLARIPLSSRHLWSHEAICKRGDAVRVSWTKVGTRWALRVDHVSQVAPPTCWPKLEGVKEGLLRFFQQSSV